MAHRYLTLLAFTACRIGDAIWLSSNEVVEVEDEEFPHWMEWQPQKTGSSYVSIPMLPPLYEAVGDIDGIFIRSETGEPFASTESLRNRVRKWCAEAGLKNRSSHGVRKAAGAILSEGGATEYQIMAIHGHASPRTSEVYTRSAQRRRLARAGLLGLKVDW
jgi:integrase